MFVTDAGAILCGWKQPRLAIENVEERKLAVHDLAQGLGLGCKGQNLV